MENNKTEREEVRIEKNTNVEVLQLSFERGGWELETLKVQGDSTYVVFVRGFNDEE